MEKKLDVNEFMRWMDTTLKGETYVPQQETPQDVTVTYGGGYCLPEEEDWYTAQVYNPESNYYYTSTSEVTYVPRTEYYEEYPDLAETVVGYIPPSYEEYPNEEKTTTTETTPPSVVQQDLSIFERYAKGEANILDLIKYFQQGGKPPEEKEEYHEAADYQTPEVTYVPRTEYYEEYPDLAETVVGYIPPSYEEYPNEEKTTTTETTPPSVVQQDLSIFERYAKGEANILDLIKYFQQGEKPPEEKEEYHEAVDYQTPEVTYVPRTDYYEDHPDEERGETPLSPDVTVTYGEGYCLPEEEKYYKSSKFNILSLLFVMLLFYFLYKKLKNFSR